jgi:cytochrome c-type biogenesis protein CcmH/NrfG
LGGLLMVTAGAIMVTRWTRTIRSRTRDEPQSGTTAGAWIVVGVVAVLFVLVTVLNLSGVW